MCVCVCARVLLVTISPNHVIYVVISALLLFALVHFVNENFHGFIVKLHIFTTCIHTMHIQHTCTYPHVQSGAIACGVYATNSPEACYYIANDCSVNIVIAENKAQVSKILQVCTLLTSLCVSKKGI